MHPVHVNLFNGFTHEHSRHGVAGKVRNGARLRHETVNTHNQPHTVHKVRAVRLQTTSQGSDTRTRDPSGAL